MPMISCLTLPSNESLGVKVKKRQKLPLKKTSREKKVLNIAESSIFKLFWRLTLRQCLWRFQNKSTTYEKLKNIVVRHLKKNVRLFASFGFIFLLNIFWMVIPRQRKKWLSPDSSFGRVSVLTAITLMQEKFCFSGISVSVFVRFAFARLGSAPLGSGRLGAREGSSTGSSWNPVITTSFVVAVSSFKKCFGEK